MSQTSKIISLFMITALLMFVGSAAPIYLFEDYDSPMAGLAILLNLVFIIAPVPLLIGSFLSYVASTRVSTSKKKTTLMLSRALLVASLIVFGLVLVGFVLSLWGTSLYGYLVNIAAVAGLAAGFYMSYILDSEIKTIEQEEQEGKEGKTKKRTSTWAWIILIAILFIMTPWTSAAIAIAKDPSLMTLVIILVVGSVLGYFYVRSKTQKRQS